MAVDLLELDSLRSERSLLATRLQLLERYRQQAAKRAAADSLTIAQQTQLIGVKNGQLAASKALQLYYADRATHYRRQRNVAIVIGTLATATVTTILIRSGHPP